MALSLNASMGGQKSMVLFVVFLFHLFLISFRLLPTLVKQPLYFPLGSSADLLITALQTIFTGGQGF